MTSRWLLEEIVYELGETPMFKTSDLFKQAVRQLVENPRVIIVDEIDYLAGNQQSIESLRDLHDRTGIPIIMVGMAMADKKLVRYKHLFDRISEILKFTAFDLEDVKMIVNDLSEVQITKEAVEFIHQRANRFRQIIKLISKAEQIAEANNLQEIGIAELGGKINAYIQVEKIAKKLSIFSVDDISVILEEPENLINEAIKELEDNKLLKNNGDNYVYIEPVREKPKRIRQKIYKRKEISYEEYDTDFINSLIKFFCAEVETSKTALVLNIKMRTVEDFYADFRKIIYEKQEAEFQKYFEKKPKTASCRNYAGTNVYLYCYGKQFFVSSKALMNKELKLTTKQERLDLKVINSMLRRRFEKCCHKFFIEHKSAECIWRRNKEYQVLVQELTKFVKECSKGV